MTKAFDDNLGGSHILEPLGGLIGRACIIIDTHSGAIQLQA
jgi:hypothetical protein